MRFFVKVIFLAILFLAIASDAFAQEKNFSISQESTYAIDENGITTVTQDIAITNLTEFFYTPSYTVNVGVKDVTNIEASNSDGTIPTTISGNDNKSIKLSFSQTYAGINKTNRFTLKFNTKDIAKKNGNTWEIAIPGTESSNDFDKYSVDVIVPASFGKELISKPKSEDLSYDKNEIGKEGIYLIYGGTQYYKFELRYNISNPNLFPVKTEIALPPSTNYQNTILTSLSHKADNVKADLDGNWIAEYKLLPQEKRTIVAKGYIEVFKSGKSEELDNKQIASFTKPLKYWESDSREIVDAVKGLATIEDIYDYVQNTLSYNRSKIASDALRLGGKGVLSNPENSVCLEFTDLFISLARAKGIPARAVEGFAFTGDSSNRPLSLVSDILHAWPEYYDFEMKKWVMVDPTWGNTTGLDYFNSLDFSHVAFVVKGIDSEYPIPAGGYKFSSNTKDVSMSFAKKDAFKKTSDLEISEDFPDRLLPKFVAKGTIKVQNSANSPQEGLEVVVQSSGGTKRKFDIDYLPPYGFQEITTSFSDTPILTKNDYIIKITVGEYEHKKNIKISFVPEFKILLLIGGIIIVSIITAAVTFHTGSLLVQRQKRKSSLRRQS